MASMQGFLRKVYALGTARPLGRRVLILFPVTIALATGTFASP